MARRLPVWRSVIPACVGAFLVVHGVRAEDPEVAPATEEVEVQADTVEYAPATGIVTGVGNVLIDYEGMVLEADRVELNRRTKDVSAEGNVEFTRGDFVWRGGTVTGNFETREFSFGRYDAVAGVWYIHGQEGTHQPDGTVRLGPTQLTTCDLHKPHYSVTARKVIYHEDGIFRAHHTVLRLGPVPVLYWPIMFGDARDDIGGITIKPGYDSDWGPYLLLGRRWRILDESSTEFQLHLRGKRGVAVGNETRLRFERMHTDFLAYGMHDLDPPETSDGYNRRFDTEDDRYRVALGHRHEITDWLEMRLSADVLSDIDMLEDWFRKDYRSNPQPRTLGDLTAAVDRISLSVRARPRVNDFFTTVEALPEVRLEMPRQHVWGPFQYRSESSVARLEMRWRDADLDRPGTLTDPEDYDTVRLDTMHSLYAPFGLGDWVRIVPRGGIRITHYGDSTDMPITQADLEAFFDVDDPDVTTSTTTVKQYDDEGGDLTRVAGELGVEVGTKIYATWPDVTNHFLELNGLRHVLNPHVNYVYAPDPSEECDDIYFFDAVDRLVEQNFVRVGLDQRLQTRRGRRIYTVARLQSYADFHFETEHSPERAGDFGSRLELRPRDDIALWGTIVTDMDESEVSRGEIGISLGHEELFEFTASYLYRNEYRSRPAYSMNSTILDFTGETSPISRSYQESHYAIGELRVPLGDKTKAELRLEYDLEESELALQRYELTRDLHCWVGSIGFEEENGDIRVMLMLYLKAYPSIHIDAGL